MGFEQPAARFSLHHVGVVVADLEAAVRRYRAMGLGDPEVFEIPDQGVRVATFVVGAGWVEIVTPTVEDSGTARFLASRGEGVHHVAYGVRDLITELQRLERAGFELIDRVPRVGAHGWRVAFVHPRSCHGVLTELVELDRP